MKTFIVILLLLLSISYTQDSIGQNKATYIDSFIENKMAESGMVGIGTAIVVDKKWLGRMDMDMLTRSTKHHLLQILS